MVLMSYKTYLGVGEESSLGTAATPTTFIEYSSESLQKEIDEQVIEAVNGTRQFTKRVTLQERTSGGFEFPVVPGTELLLLKNLSGSNYTMTTVSTGAVFQFDFYIDTVVSNTSLTFQKCNNTSGTGTAFAFKGSRINTADFNVGVGGLLNCSVDILGQDVATATVETASYGSEAPYTFKDAAIKIGNDSATSTDTALDNWSLSLDQALIDDFQLGQATRSAIEPGMMNVTGEVSMSYLSNTVVDRFLNKTKSFIECVFTGPSITDASNHQITFRSYNTYFNGSLPNIGGPNEIIKHSLPYRAIREDGSVGAMLVSVITNVNTIT